MTNRPAPIFTGSVWACPVCDTAWQRCECAEGFQCRAPSASTPTRAGRGVAPAARRVRR